MAKPVAFVPPFQSGKTTRVLYECRKSRKEVVRLNVSKQTSAVQVVKPIQHPRGHSLPKLEDGEEWVPIPDNIPSQYYRFYLRTRAELAPCQFDELGPFDSLEWVSDTNRLRFMNANEIILPGDSVDFIPQNLHLWEQRPSQWVPLNV